MNWLELALPGELASCKDNAMGIYDDVYKFFAKNFDVYDGDSFKADMDEGDYRWELQRPFRLYGIDTPEIAPRWEHYTDPNGVRQTSARDLEKQAAVEARNRVVEYLAAADGKVVVQTIKLPGNPVRDKYGRTLARLWVPIGGRMIDVAGRLLVEMHARPYDGGTKGAWAALRSPGTADPPPGLAAKVM